MTMTEQPTTDQTAAPCPCCGSYAGATLATQSSALLAVCDVLVVRALEVMGKRIVRDERNRFSVLAGRPWHIAHTIWAPEPAMIRKALQGAWVVVPAMLDAHGCCGVTAQAVTRMLDRYVADLLLTQTEQSLAELVYRFGSELGIHTGGAPWAT